MAQVKNDVRDIFPARLRSEMEKTGINQGDLAGKAGLTQSSISNYLRGIRLPGADELLRLSMALDISGEWLLGLEGPLPFPEAGLSRPSQRRNPPFQEAASESSPAYRAAVDPAAEWKQRALAAEKKLKAIEALLNS